VAEVVRKLVVGGVVESKVLTVVVMKEAVAEKWQSEGEGEGAAFAMEGGVEEHL
jgi:hypothetical protein